MSQAYDVIVIGAGHAGCEAAAAVARLGKRVAVVTLNLKHIGRLSCNPAIGGLAKGNLVREIDALGGIMARVADASCIQFRRLNTRKGLAVQASRAQVDMDAYPLEMQKVLASFDLLSLVEAEVTGLRMTAGRVSGVVLGDGSYLYAPAVIVTAGTFLSGVLHTGDVRTIGGRVGDGSAHALSGNLADLGLRLGRLKTGTPPRLDTNTIDWDRIAVQHDTVPEGRFSFAELGPRLPQINCHMVYTNARTHEIIAAQIHRSPLFSGVIEGTGPRYCPSIEDKVVRFPDKERHLVFLEPEGLNTTHVYPNGLSTSLPLDVQVDYVQSIEGLENARILVPGYAVEYDFADPRDLGHDLQHRSIPGLFLAGQVNGTSGYEEAAAQGLVAGVSAATGTTFQLARDAAYIGVMIDDLVTRGVGGEPYRMFTSRAEHRLLLREDNADRRLMPTGREWGLVSDEEWDRFTGRSEQYDAAEAALNVQLTPSVATQQAFADADIGTIKGPMTARELLKRQGVDWNDVRTVAPSLPELPTLIAEQLTTDVRYEGYIAKAERQAEAMRGQDTLPFPPNWVWADIRSVSTEVRERLGAAQPKTLGQAARVPGVTAAAVQQLAALMVKYSVQA
ncbi:MAG: tRNA uridine 5-carboxymethylaminomethyl modification enzyme [Myxococcota bacterium]|jgi:tRNA uridine 5-carboxymethylaminomethyl modification enzyme